MKNILVCGINGHMGQILEEQIQKSDIFSLAAGVDIADGEGNGYKIYQNIFDCAEKIDVVIDFSRPAALENNLRFCKERNIPIIIATTGYTIEDRIMMQKYAEDIPIFFSANMSMGVNLQMSLCKEAAQFLGTSADIEIIEKHHHRKVDAPSGTALAIADSINTAYTPPLSYTYGRSPESGKRKPGELGFHSVRGGSIVGEHDVLFICEQEVLEIKHTAESREIFAHGALRAAAFIWSKPCGMYDMHDVIAESQQKFGLEFCEDSALIVCSGFTEPASLLSVISDAALHTGNIKTGTDSSMEISVPMNELAYVETILNKNNISYIIPATFLIRISGIISNEILSKAFNALSGIKVVSFCASKTELTVWVNDTVKEIAKDAILKAFN